jgi:hypothetical protein
MAPNWPSHPELRDSLVAGLIVLIGYVAVFIVLGIRGDPVSPGSMLIQLAFQVPGIALLVGLASRVIRGWSRRWAR